MIKRRLLLPLAGAMCLFASACTSVGGGGGWNSPYVLARHGKTINVGNGAVSVIPPRDWNRTQRSILFSDVRWVEDWTLNGPYLDGISFVTALPDNERLVRESRRADRQVPKFRREMTAPEVASLIETWFRVRGGTVDFRTLSLAPRPFLGANGFQFDFEHLDSDELWRKGRAVGAVIDGRLYLMLYDAARSHYYDAALPDFEAMVASAHRRR
ncbi:hypothetical protein [Sphingomonas arenae]|uniref:hypothetical protein n=1 Tax=Sphingomonas arenae TaxID=2812555 RepID=UPI001968711F|nr:hypothetical protein [Sphingomonas arenae]